MSTTNLDSLSLSDLTRHIENTHHTYMKTLLPEISTLFSTALNLNDPLIEKLERIFSLTKAEMVQHTVQEEQVLFPMMRDVENQSQNGMEICLSCGGLSAPIAVMETEHDSVLESIAEMRTLTSGFSPPENSPDVIVELYRKLHELETDVKIHIAVENELLHKKARTLESSGM